MSLVMLAECAAWVLWGAGAPVPAVAARQMQIVPSMLGATLASGLSWLLATILLGRVYCSAFCPLGVLQDMAVHGRRTAALLLRRRHKPFGYKPARPIRFWMLGAYIVGVVGAVGCLPLLLEPWPAFVNAVSSVAEGTRHASLAYLGVGALLGFVCAAVSVVMVMAYAFLAGRDFCNEICPVGTVLGVLSARSAMHIELIPDRCTSCLKCEEVCKASCISIKDRMVDNTRCVRCFNCVNVCPDNAIRYQLDRTGIISPLLQRHPEASS